MGRPLPRDSNWHLESRPRRLPGRVQCGRGAEGAEPFPLPAHRTHPQRAGGSVQEGGLQLSFSNFLQIGSFKYITFNETGSGLLGHNLVIHLGTFCILGGKAVKWVGSMFYKQTSSWKEVETSTEHHAQQHWDRNPSDTNTVVQPGRPMRAPRVSRTDSRQQASRDAGLETRKAGLSSQRGDCPEGIPVSSLRSLSDHMNWGQVQRTVGRNSCLCTQEILKSQWLPSLLLLKNAQLP